MDRLQRLTAKQKTKLTYHLEKWDRLSRSTSPIDLDLCKELIARIYHTLELPSPRVELVDSPLAGVILFALLTTKGHDVETGWDRSGIRKLLKARVSPRAINTNANNWLSHALKTQVREAQVRTQRVVLNQIQEDLGAPIPMMQELLHRHFGGSIPTQLEGPLNRALRCLASFRVQDIELGSMCKEDYLLHTLDLAPYQPMKDLIELGEQAGWWLADEELVVLIQRPTDLHYDAQDRLHRMDGPAVRYPDGFSVYAHHGAVIPNFVIEAPETITAEMIKTEPNAEVARVMLLQFGEERFLEQFTPKGPPWRGSQLYETVLGRDTWRPPRLARVRCLNSTPEPDGTIKIYWLRVPPGTSCAQEALAAIHVNPFRKDWTDYQPLVET